MLNFIKFIFKFSMISLLLGVLAIIGVFYYYSKDLPDFSNLQNYHPPAVTRIYSSDGKLVEEYAKEHRVFVPITTIPKSLIEAFIAAEDGNYYAHSGIDLMSITRAAISNIGNMLQNKRMQGGSTITQQVVKNFLLTSERSLPRKIKEAILSYTISKAMTKEQVLELYLNQIYLGKGAYGVAAAATAYFNKSVDELNVAESAFIASLPKAPSSMNPDKYYERSLARRNYVISRMLEDGYITSQVAATAKQEPITLVKRDKAETVTADYYAEQVREQIIALFGPEMFYTGGLTVITSMDTKYQKQAESSLRKGIRNYDRLKGYRGPIAKIELTEWQSGLKNVVTPDGILEYKLAVILAVENTSASIGLPDGTTSNIPLKEMLWAATNLTSAKKILKPGDVVVVEPQGKVYALRQIPKVNGAFMAMHPVTGQVLALAGGYDFKVSKFNRATQAIRQPGSCIKPIIYLSALEHGIKPNMLFEDGPIALSQGRGMPLWKPKNYKNDFLGTITMRTALEKSRNLVTVRIMQQVGIENIAEIVKRFGIAQNPAHYFSMGLGAVDTTVEKMLTAYSAIANGGTQVKPQYIEVIKDANGKVIYRRDSGICYGCRDGANIPSIEIPIGMRLTDEATNYQVISLMEGAVQRGTAGRAKVLGKIIAGKTGTTNDSLDTWFIGYTPILSTATYIGYDTPRTLGKTATGSSVASPIFVDFMENAYKDKPSLAFKIPDSITQKMVDRTTGRIDPAGTVLESFKKDEEYDNNGHDENHVEDSDTGIY